MKIKVRCTKDAGVHSVHGEIKKGRELEIDEVDFASEWMEKVEDKGTGIENSNPQSAIPNPKLKSIPCAKGKQGRETSRPTVGTDETV